MALGPKEIDTEHFLYERTIHLDLYKYLNISYNHIK